MSDISSLSKDSPQSPLSATLNAISFTGSNQVWRDDDVGSSGSIVVYIDPANPHIWLPVSACKVFEEVFGLEWNATAELYLINATTHDRLTRLNSTVTFFLYPGSSAAQAKSFTMSYVAFDLNVTYPLVEVESYCFPLRRASMPDQYLLGRAFPQETHVSVNYDTARLNISQATVVPGATEDLVTLFSPAPPKKSTSKPISDSNPTKKSPEYTLE